MANHRSAEKRNRQNIKRREQNRSARSAIRTAIKETTQLADSGQIAEAEASAKKATSLLDKAIIHGVHHGNNVSRRVSRLYSHISRAKSAQ